MFAPSSRYKIPQDEGGMGETGREFQNSRTRTKGQQNLTVQRGKDEEGSQDEEAGYRRLLEDESLRGRHGSRLERSVIQMLALC